MKRKRAATSKQAHTRQFKAARTAGGKKGSPQVLAEASITAQEGLRERTEAGHRAAGRTPPSEKTPARSSGAARIVAAGASILVAGNSIFGTADAAQAVRDLRAAAAADAAPRRGA